MIIFHPPGKPNLITARDPRLRTAAAFAFALLVVTFRGWPALLGAAGLALCLVAAARVLNPLTGRRLIELNLFVLLLVVFLPLSVPGRTLWRVGPAVWTAEGFAMALRIALKANTVMLCCGALLATMDPSQLGHALGRLGVPDKLVYLFLFMVRYVEVIHEEYHRLRHAMKLRAFRATCSMQSLRGLGYLVGMLFVRSLDRSERIYEAMKCRGFQGRFYALAPFRCTAGDAVFGGAAVAAAVVLTWVETA